MRRFSKALFEEAESQLQKTKKRQTSTAETTNKASALSRALKERRLENHFSESLRQLYETTR